MERIPVGILGATGVVGQHYVTLLADHPWFEVAFLASSQRSANQSYGKAVRGRWRQQQPLPERLQKLPVHSIDEIETAQKECRLVFSAVSSDVAQQYEQRYAQAGLAVVSNSSYHRRDVDVPVVIPEINPHHLEVIPSQKQRRSWKHGFIVVKPNCSIQSYLIPLWPLQQAFGIERLVITTLQAVSGAGYPGVPAVDMMDNILPYIAGEEEKSEWETCKILGNVKGDAIVSLQDLAITAHCNRVPVSDGHLACVSVKFHRKPSLEAVLDAWKKFKGLPQLLGLPSAPLQPISYRNEPDRPQPRLDRNAGEGMAVTVGRLRSCPVLDLRFVGLSHNTIRGAAGGGILIAELLVQQQYVDASLNVKG